MLGRRFGSFRRPIQWQVVLSGRWCRVLGGGDLGEAERLPLPPARQAIVPMSAHLVEHDQVIGRQVSQGRLDLLLRVIQFPA